MLFCFKTLKKFSVTKENGCLCPICKCTCSATFRQDQLQSIHIAKSYEDFQNFKEKSSSTSSAGNASTGSTHTAIGQLTNVITDIAKDSILQVLQQDSPTKRPRGCCSSANHVNLYDNDSDDGADNFNVKKTLDCSLGVTSTALARDPMIADNIGLKNQLCQEMGGTPSTVLNSTGQTVARYWDDNSRSCGHHSRCPRSSRNSLLDLWSSDSNKMKQSKLKLLKRIKLKLFKIALTKDGQEKKV